MLAILAGVACMLMLKCAFCLQHQVYYPRVCGKVHLTVSSQYDTYLELNWVTECNRPGDRIPDYIILSDKDLRDRNEDTAPLVKIKASEHPSGYYRTRYKFGYPWLPGNWEYSIDLTRADPGPHCFPFWIASVIGRSIVDSRCLQIQPTWMNDNRNSFGRKKIGDLFIPGTHNSGSYGGVGSIFQDYVSNQDRSVWTQLVFGIRYLDFRIGYYGKEGFFINHDLVKVTNIVPVLQQIRKFLELAPSEVVIVDFHRFPYPSNFTKSLHNQFVNLVYQHLGELALPPHESLRDRGPTLDYVLEKGKNLIVCYAERHMVREQGWLWSPMQQYWGDTKKVTELRSFISRTIKSHNSHSNPMWALMAELTPQTFDIIFHTNGLRKLAQDINKQITKWFRDEWASEVNIVATDYFLGNDLINVAIETNKKKR